MTIRHEISIPWYGLNPKGQLSLSSAICKLRWRCHHLHQTSSSGEMLRHSWWSKSSGSLQQNLVLGKTWRPRASVPRIDVRGIWWHTWLQGKPRTTSPLSLYLSYRAWSPRKWVENPLWVRTSMNQSETSVSYTAYHLDATFTIKTVLPCRSAKSYILPLGSSAFRE